MAGDRQAGAAPAIPGFTFDSLRPDLAPEDHAYACHGMPCGAFMTARMWKVQIKRPNDIIVSRKKILQEF